MKKLDLGFNANITIRKETYVHNQLNDLTVMYVSDLHFNGFNESKIAVIIEAIHQQNPDIVLLGGDYADSPKGFAFFGIFLQKLSHRKNVFAIGGNHDYLYGIKKMKALVEKNNIQWIEKSSIEVEIRGQKIVIDGNIIASPKAENSLYICCLHKPLTAAKIANMHYHLVFAGHLHGCQFVFWQKENDLYPGKFFFRNNFLKKEIGKCLYIVSKGLGDMLPIRYNCVKEIILVEFVSKKLT